MKKIIIILCFLILTAKFAGAVSFEFSSDDNEGKIKATCSCPNGYPLIDEKGYCHACDEVDVIKLADKESCERLCNGQNGTTKRVADFWGCKLEGCPANKPLEDSFGKCRSCKYDGPVSDTKNCARCPNRKVKEGQCIIANCTNRPLIGTDNLCYPCTTGLSVATLRGKCTSVCPNRRENGSWSSTENGVKTSGVYCVLGSDGDD